MPNEVLNLNVFKTQDGLFISSPSGYQITTPYLINGKELTPTHKNRWLLLKDEVEVKTVQRPYPSRKEPDCYVIKDDSFFVDGKIPKKIKYEDVDGYFEKDDGGCHHKRKLEALQRYLEAVEEQRDEFRLKAAAYERIEQAYFDNDNYSDEQFMELIEETIEEVASDLEGDHEG